MVGSALRPNELNLVPEKKLPYRSKLRQRNHLFYNTSILCCQDKMLTVQRRSSLVMSADSHCAKPRAQCEYVVLFHSTAWFRHRTANTMYSLVSFSSLRQDKNHDIIVWTLLQDSITQTQKPSAASLNGK